MLASFGVRQEFADDASYLVSSTPMVHDAVAYPGRLVQNPGGLLLLEVAVADQVERLIAVFEDGTTYGDGRLVSPSGSKVRVGESFTFDRGTSRTWTGDQILGLFDGEDAERAWGVGF